MPTYGYRCTVCAHEFERVQKMTDASLKECENCGQPVKKVLYPVGISFKGSGFYVTDYKGAGKEEGGGAPKAEGGGETAAKTDGDSAPKTDSTVAPAPTTGETGASSSATPAKADSAASPASSASSPTS